MPGRIDQNRPFLPVNIAILTVSDTRDASQDRSGDTLADLVTSAGHRVATRKIVRDEQEMIVAQLKEWIADPDIDAWNHKLILLEYVELRYLRTARRRAIRPLPRA